MRIEPFDPAADHEAVRVCHEIYLAGADIDQPDLPPWSLRVFAGWLAEGWMQEPSQTWLARGTDGAPVGWVALFLPERENRELARVRPVVHPARRRGGIGAALLRHAATRAHTLGRETIEGETLDSTPGAEFARRLGARPGIPETLRLLAVDQLPDGHLAALRPPAQQAAHGYALVSWAGPTPPDEVAGVVRVLADENDAPRDEGREDIAWDEARVRQADRRAQAQGVRRYTVAARCHATGELAALTALQVDPATPGWGFQELTVVARPHRGHRLGMLVKLAMLELLAEREPQLSRIVTGNADENAHMIAINDQLGFRPVARERAWELQTARALPDTPQGLP